MVDRPVAGPKIASHTVLPAAMQRFRRRSDNDVRHFFCFAAKKKRAPPLDRALVFS